MDVGELLRLAHDPRDAWDAIWSVETGGKTDFEGERELVLHQVLGDAVSILVGHAAERSVVRVDAGEVSILVPHTTEAEKLDRSQICGEEEDRKAAEHKGVEVREELGGRHD